MKSMLIRHARRGKKSHSTFKKKKKIHKNKTASDSEQVLANKKLI